MREDRGEDKIRDLTRVLVLVTVIALLSTSASQGSIETFGFYNITNNDGDDPATTFLLGLGGLAFLRKRT